MIRRQHLSSIRRGTAVAAMVIVMAVIGLIVTGLVLSGSRDQDLTVRRLESARAFYAGEAAANMAVKEIVDGVDYDGDGHVGGVSDDSSNATDPTINSSTRLNTAVTASSGVSTCSARGTISGTTQKLQVTVSGTGTSGGATILFVVVNSSSLDAQESARKAILEGWGYTVVPITATASQASYDAALRTSSAVYVCETALSSDIDVKLTSTPLGVVDEEAALSDELGIAASMTTFTDNRVDIINNSHYITSSFSTGSRTLFTAAQPVRYLSGAYGSFTTLGRQVSTTNPTFAVMDRGAALTPSGAAAGRRVYLPWGNTGVDINNLNADGLTVMQRSLEWAMLPIAWWKFDESSGSTADDAVGSHNGTAYSTTWTTGHVDGGLQFNGTDSRVEVPNASSLQLTSAISVAAWMRCDSSSSWPNGSVTAPIVRKGTSEPCNYAVHVANGKLTMCLDENDTAGAHGNTTLNVGQWYHLAATWDGSTVRLYVNGVLDNTPASKAAPVGTDTRLLNIGGRSGGERFNGRLDDVRLYSRALTAGEVAALANAGHTITSWAQVAPN